MRRVHRQHSSRWATLRLSPNVLLVQRLQVSQRCGHQCFSGPSWAHTQPLPVGSLLGSRGYGRACCSPSGHLLPQLSLLILLVADLVLPPQVLARLSNCPDLFEHMPCRVSGSYRLDLEAGQVNTSLRVGTSQGVVR